MTSMSCRWRATQPGNVLEARFQIVDRFRKMQLEITDFVDLSKSGCRVLSVILFFFIFGVELLVSSCRSAWNFQNFGMNQNQRFRIDISLSTLNASPLECTSSLRINFSLLRNGSEMPAIANLNETQFKADQRVCRGWVNLSRPQFYNGIVISNISGRFAAGTLIGISASSNEIGVDAKAIAWKLTRNTANGIRVLAAGDGPSIPASPDLAMDYTASWPLILETVSPGFILGTCSVALALCGALGHPAACRLLLPAACTLVSLLYAATAAGYSYLPGIGREAFLPAFRAAIFAAATFAVRFSAQLAPHVALALAVVDLAARVVLDAVIYPDAARLRDAPQWNTLVIAAAAACLVIVRRRLLRRAIEAVLEDMALYDRAWGAWRSDPALDRVRHMAALASKECPSAPPQQRLMRLRARERLARFTSQPGSWNTERPARRVLVRDILVTVGRLRRQRRQRLWQGLRGRGWRAGGTAEYRPALCSGEGTDKGGWSGDVQRGIGLGMTGAVKQEDEGRPEGCWGPG